jgi:hypothetical protein
MNQTYTTVDCVMDAFTRAEVLDDEGGEYTPMSDAPLGLSGEYKFSYTYPTECAIVHELQPFMSAIDVGLFVAADCKAEFAGHWLYFEGYTVDTEARTIETDITA